MKKYFNKILFILTLFIFTFNKSNGQLDCPSPIGLLDWIGFAENDYPASEIANAPYKYRVIGGNTFDIKVDWNLLDKNDVYHLSDKQAKELLIQGIINQRIPQCPTTQVYTFRFYEEKPCLRNATCYLKVDQDNSVFCKDESWVDEPSFFNYNGIKYYPLTTQVQCGTACCITEYVIECEDVVQGQQPRYKIVSKTFSSFGCTETTIVDCKTGLLTPCEVQCE